MPGVNYTSDENSIDFTYKTTVNGIEKTYTASFIKEGNVFSYTYTDNKNNEDTYYQALLNNVATDAMFYALGNANGINDDYLEDMAKDFSKYNYYNHGIEIKTNNYKGTINDKEVNIAFVKSFKMDVANISITGNANLAPKQDENIENEKIDVEIVEKENPIKVIVISIIAVIITLLILVLIVKNKHSKNNKKHK